MSQQGPIIVVANAGRPSFASALDDAKMFPVIDTTLADAARAVEQLQPAAVIVAMPATVQPGFEALAELGLNPLMVEAFRDRTTSS